MKEETKIAVLSETFDLYMKNAREAKAHGKIALAKKNFLLASETMMRMAKQSDGKLKEVRMDRARALLDIAEGLAKEDLKSSKKNNETKEEDESVKKWQAAKIPDIKFSDVAGLEEVKKAITIRMINPIKYPDKYKMYGKKTGGGVLCMAHQEREKL